MYSRYSKNASKTEKKRRLVKHSIYNMAALIILEICVFFYIDEQRLCDVGAAAARGIANDLNPRPMLSDNNSELKIYPRMIRPFKNTKNQNVDFFLGWKRSGVAEFLLTVPCFLMGSILFWCYVFQSYANPIHYYMSGGQFSSVAQNSKLTNDDDG